MDNIELTKKKIDKGQSKHNNEKWEVEKKQINDIGVIKKTKIFEKEEIRWVCMDEIKKMKPQFRFFFKPIVDRLYNEREDIKKFIMKGLKVGIPNLKKRTRRNKTRKVR